MSWFKKSALLEIPLDGGDLALSAWDLPKGTVLLPAHLVELWRDFPANQQIWSLANLIALQENGLISTSSVAKSFRRAKFASYDGFFEAWLHITNQCNLRCTYCYLYKNQDDMSEEVGRLTIDRLLAHCQQCQLKQLKLKFSGGEALLRWRFVKELWHYAQQQIQLKQLNVKLSGVVLSNGVPISKRLAEEIKAEGLRVSISLDGLGKCHDQQRIFPDGRGSFKLVMRGIECLQAAGVSFSVSVTITKHNVSELAELTKYLMDRKIIFSFNFFRENPHADHSLAAGADELIAGLSKSYQVIQQHQYIAPHVNFLLDRTYIYNPRVATCGVARSYVTIKPNGDLTPCQMAYEQVVANIAEQDWWDKVRATKLCGKSVAPSFADKPACHHCQFAPWCGGGCPLLAQQYSGSTTGANPYCRVYKTMIPELIKLDAELLLRRKMRIISR